MKGIFLSGLLITSVASAVEIDVNVGVGKFINSSPVLWQTMGFESDMKMIAPSGEIGLTENLWESDSGKFGLNARQSFVYLGSVHTKGPTPSRHTKAKQGAFIGMDFLGGNGECQDGPCTDMSAFDGSGHSKGITLQLEPYYTVNGYKIGINGGAYINRSTWSVNVKHLDDPNGTGGFVDVTVESQQQKWNVGKVLGVSVSKGDFTLRYQYFSIPAKGPDEYPAAWQGAHMLSIGYTF